MSMEPEEAGMSTAERAGEPGKAAEVGRIARATSAVGAVRLGLILTGLAWRFLTAWFLGSELTANAFNWTNDRIMQFFQMWDKLLRPTVIPMFMQERRERGEEAAWRFASTVTNMLVLVVLPLTVVGVMYAPQIVAVLTQYRGETEALSVRMWTWMFLAVPALALSVIGYLMLNSYKRFGLAALGDLALKTLTVVGLVALFKFWGWPALVAGVVAGAALKLGMYVWGLRRELRQYRPALDLTSPVMKQFYVLMLPVLVGAVVALGRDYAEGYFRTGVEEGRAASIVNYGRMWVDVPIQVVMMSLGIAIFPFISEASAKGRHRELFEGFFTIGRGIFLLFVPMTVAVVMLRTPLIHTLLQWGKFSPSDTALTSQTLLYYAFAFVPLAMEMVLLPYFYARKNTLIPTAAGVVTSVLNIGLLWWLLREAAMGIGAFTLAVVVTKGLKVAVLIGLLKFLFPEEHNWGHELRRLGSGLLRVAAATAVMVLVMWAMDAGLGKVLNVQHRLQGIVYLGAIIAAGAGSYLAMVALLRVEEVRMAMGWAGQKLRRGRK